MLHFSEGRKHYDVSLANKLGLEFRDHNNSKITLKHLVENCNVLSSQKAPQGVLRFVS